MDEIKRKVLQELIDKMDSKMGDNLKSKKPNPKDDLAAMTSRVDTGWGKTIVKDEDEPKMDKPMAMNESSSDESEDEKRLKEMYSKLK